MRSIVTAIFTCVLLTMLITGCAAPSRPATGATPTPGTSIPTPTPRADSTANWKIVTADKVPISGRIYPAEGEHAVLLIHQLGGDKESMDGLAQKLHEAGLTVLAIDLRGHGDSLSVQSGYYRTYTTEQWKAAVNDITTAVNSLQSKGYTEVDIIGASIGGNLALLYAASEESKTSRIALLSPTIDYRGVTTGTAATTYKGKLLLVASSEDQYAYESSQMLYTSSPSQKKEFRKYDNAGHGIEMLNGTDLADYLVEWLKK